MVSTIPTALITGGAQRVGAAITRDLAANGFAVAIHCNASRTEADALASEIVTAGGTAHVVQGDLTDPDARAALVQAAQQALGPVQLLVNNASVFDDDSAQDFNWSTWDRHFDVHLKAPGLADATGRRTPSLRPGRACRQHHRPARVAAHARASFSYTLSKSALWTATQTMAQAFAPRLASTRSGRADIEERASG
jgi:NAD(P)-dependent dehydrogenase (short-subunit alcohol dehydrogenase family)